MKAWSAAPRWVKQFNRSMYVVLPTFAVLGLAVIWRPDLRTLGTSICLGTFLLWLIPFVIQGHLYDHS